MKILTILLAGAFSIAMFASSAGAAELPLNEKCLKKIERTANATATLLSGVQAGIDSSGLADQIEPAGQDQLGRALFKVSTGKFFIADGYLSGDGATVTVLPEGTSCRIMKMEISIAK